MPTKLLDEWTEDDDLELLTSIHELDVSDDEDIDFHELAENLDKDTDNTKRRWAMLVKGLGGMQQGKRYKVRDQAKRMVEDIKTRHERYIPWIGNKKN